MTPMIVDAYLRISDSWLHIVDLDARIDDLAARFAPPRAPLHNPQPLDAVPYRPAGNHGDAAGCRERRIAAAASRVAGLPQSTTFPRHVSYPLRPMNAATSTVNLSIASSPAGSSLHNRSTSTDA